MLRILLVIMLVFLPVMTLADESDYSQEVLAKRNVDIKNYINESTQWDWEKIKVEGYKSANGEFKAAIDFLYQQDPDTQPFIKFFTTYAIPHKIRKKAVYTLSFALHSLIAFSEEIQLTYRPLAIDKDGELIPFQQVSGTDTLWWIDIRDYGWNNASFENIVLNDGYFVEPIVDARLAFLLEQEGLSPNIILRADWFVRHALDITKQTDKRLKSIYETLIYSRLNKPPQTVDEWKELWGGNSVAFQATLVTKSKAVSRYNRVLVHEEGRFGGAYETFDVLSQEGGRDYLDDIFNFVDNVPRIFDAKELFAANQLHLLVYTLSNENEDLVDFGDPTAVRHSGDILGDVRVRIAHSCIDCHASGPLTAENTLNDLLGSGTKIRVPDFDQKADLEAVYLGSGFDFAVETDSQRYASAIKRVNGLTPEQNVANYLALVSWYEKPLNISQAAIEVGLSPDIFVERIRGKVGARLALLVNGGEGIPRDIWDSPGVDGVPGAFQQAAIVVFNLFFKDVRFKFKHEAFDFEQKKNTKGILKRRGVITRPTKEIEEPEIKLKPVKPNLTYTHFYIKYEAPGWNPGARTDNPPDVRLVGPASWPITGTNEHFVGTKLKNGDMVWLLRKHVWLYRKE